MRPLRHFLTVTGIAFGCALTAFGEPARLDRNALLQYHDASGKVRPVKTHAEWRHRREEIVRGMQAVMGKLPGERRRVSLDMTVDEEVDVKNYIRRRITYQSEPGSRTTAYLCIPKDVLAGRRKAPAVLCLHPTDVKWGYKVALGLGGRSGRQYGAELADRGYVTLTPSYPHLGDYWPCLERLGYVSGCMKAIWDNIRAMDLLASLPFVDDSRGFGAIGHSLGAHNAIFTAVFDPRITVLASSCGFDSFLDYRDGQECYWYVGRKEGWCNSRYMPRLSDYRGRLEDIPFDFHEVVGALAPRPFFVSAPLHDDIFQWKSADECVKAARPVYRLLGGDGNIILRHPDCGHDFPKELREEAYELIDSVLRSDSK